MTSAPPTTSTGPVASGSYDSGTCRQATAVTATATGRLMPKIHRQDTSWTSQPPRNGPRAVATPPSPDHAPIALPRSAGTNEACRIARLPGVRRAAPTPCNARAAIRTGAVGAIPHGRDASANQTTPIRKIRFRPYRSPSAPATRSSPASVSVYAVTTHCRVAIPVWNPRPIEGSAMPTTVA